MLLKNASVRINCLEKNGMTPLDQAAFKGNEQLVEMLLAAGADADNRAHDQGYTCLMFAALAGSYFWKIVYKKYRKRLKIKFHGSHCIFPTYSLRTIFGSASAQ